MSHITIGSALYGELMIDGEKCRYEGYDIDTKATEKYQAKLETLDIPVTDTKQEFYPDLFGFDGSANAVIPHCTDVEAKPVFKKFTARNSKVLAYIKKHYNAKIYSNCLYFANLTKSELGAVNEVLQYVNPDYHGNRYLFYTGMIDGMAKG